MKRIMSFVMSGICLLLICSNCVLANPEIPLKIPVKDMVTMVDLGAQACAPCKLMAPIKEELRKEYRGKASIIFIDVWENQSEAKKYGIKAIPTQIFYDKNGKEVFRNTGFINKQRIVAIFEKLGVNKK